MRFFKITILFLLSIILVGCSHSSSIRHNSAYNALLSEMYARGVFIAKNDKIIMFKIPNSVFFKQDSINFNTGSYDILEFMLDFSNYCKVDEISIAGYGKNKFIMQERAHKIGEYLWQAKVNTNFVYSYGNNDKDDCIIIKYSLI